MKGIQTKSLKFGVVDDNNVLSSVDESFDLPDIYFSEMVWKKLKERKEDKKPILVNADTGHFMTSAQVLQTCTSIANFLLSHGIREEDVVFGYSSNNQHYACCVLAVPAMGAVLTGCLNLFPLPALVKQMSTQEPLVMLCSTSTLGIALQAVLQVTSVRFIIVTDSFGDEEGGQRDAATLPVYNMGHVMNADHDPPVHLPLVPLNKDPSSAMIYMMSSSGSTGAPKTVARPHKPHIAHMLGMENGTAFEYRNPGDVVSGRLLIPHLTGPLIIMKSMYYCNTLVIMKDLVMDKFLQAIEKYRVNHVIAVPTLVTAMANAQITAGIDVSSLTSIAIFGSVLSPAVEQQFRSKFSNCSLFSQMYGTTESGQITFSDESVIDWIDSHPEKRATVGRLIRGVQVRIMDRESKSSLPPSTMEHPAIGELEIHGPCQVEGYHRNEKADAENFDENKYWFKTGDAAFFDEDGLLFVVDRYKEIFKWEGMQVSPTELESVLKEHPNVKDAAVIGIHEGEHREVAHAFVVATGSESVDLLDVVCFHNEKMPNHKWIKYLSQVKTLPVIGVGKIDKGKVRCLSHEEIIQKIRFLPEMLDRRSVQSTE